VNLLVKDVDGQVGLFLTSAEDKGQAIALCEEKGELFINFLLLDGIGRALANLAVEAGCDEVMERLLGEILALGIKVGRGEYRKEVVLPPA